ncbi:hypothetical protein A6R68_06753 [Neotoma lepida]|uniref:RNA polymerase II elongation factor ELL N-terminal domain-containing protein n=1 Tax=Neotoma lepida TaxID=56216 RepID=A0A1A6GEM6_NEOLE|nr:hypothetical protein A6R68_06753 [Neotoma lepida]
MAALQEARSYGLSCGRVSDGSRVSVFHVKLTDSALKAFESYRAHQAFSQRTGASGQSASVCRADSVTEGPAHLTGMSVLECDRITSSCALLAMCHPSHSALSGSSVQFSARKVRPHPYGTGVSRACLLGGGMTAILKSWLFLPMLDKWPPCP